MSLVIRSPSIYVAQMPIDFRLGINGLCGIIQGYFKTNPTEGLYVFYNRRRNRLKLLVWHHNGFMLIYKQLAHGQFPFVFSEKSDTLRLHEKQLQGLLLGLDWQHINGWQDIEFSYF